MAVGKATHAGARRFVYGFNALIQIALVVIVVVAVMAFSRNGGQVDLTRTGVNSLSPRTEALLDDVEQDVRITAIYTVLSEYDERAQKRQRVVDDLLQLYEASAGGRVTAELIDPMKDRGQFAALLQRLREKPAYQDEAAPHKQVIEEFPKLNQRIIATLDAHMAEIERLFAANQELQNSALVQVTQELNRLKSSADGVTASIAELVGQDIPFYGQAVNAVQGYLETCEAWMKAVDEWVADKASQSPMLTSAAIDFLKRSVDEYNALLPDITALLEQTRELNEVELETLANKLNRWATAPPILVETDEQAEVLSFSEVWPFRTDQAAMMSGDADDREFAGEQAISSAILKMTQTERTAVVFVRWGGPSPIVPDFSQMNMMQRQMPRAPYGVLNELLGKENFVTEDWDVKQTKTPPEVNDAVRTVYVIFPPTPPEQPDPRRASPEPRMAMEDVQIVLDAVAESGMAIFLAGYSPPTSPMAPPTPYIYADYLRSDWGIDVEDSSIVVRFMPSPENPDLYIPQRPATVLKSTGRGGMRLSDHPIVDPLQASPIGLSDACPLHIVEDVPAGVRLHELVTVSATSDVWAVADIMTLQRELTEQRGTRPDDDDLMPPFAVALAGAQEDGPRIVVIASERFASDQLVEAPGGYAFTGSGLVAYPAYPGNPDFFINAVHWLTNEANRISVGARRTEVPRLSGLEEGFWLDFWRVFLVGIWPGLALVVGGGVWLFRRR